jgi:hypothetical protein
MVTVKHTAETLTQEFWSRRRAGELSVRITKKQAAWLQSLLHQMDRQMPYTHTYVLPTTGTPLAMVIYPNGSGFIKVEDFAAEYDHERREWRIKPQYQH